ncbi:MAG: RluA family pseudouridine synthase [Alphaproteobacteria bacterium]|nr:RluA family pseudouridine synthase [Alphaproteobacteria bacterium]
MSETQQLHIQVTNPSEVGLRLDKFLSSKTNLSRTRISSLIKDGYLKPDLPADFKVVLGQTFDLTLPPAQEATPTAQKIPLDILYEDDDLIVLNKPAGMVVHPGAGNFSGTLVNALLAHCGDSLSGIGGVKRPGIVHRIDKETSGVLVVAKNDITHQKLSEQFSVHSIHRVYQAVVYGLTPYEGTVRGNIGRSPTNRQKMAIVQQGGKPAVTHFKLIKPLFNGKASLIECRLETGRTHQIRVHMTSIKHPLVGDKTYGNAPKGTPEILRLFPRQALHAAELGFIHPNTGKNILLKAPMPTDMQLLIQASDVM